MHAFSPVYLLVFSTKDEVSFEAVLLPEQYALPIHSTQMTALSPFYDTYRLTKHKLHISPYSLIINIENLNNFLTIILIV